MTTNDFTPPPPPPLPPAGGPVPPAEGPLPSASGAVPPASGPPAGRVIAILAAVLGGLVAVVTVGGAAVATVGSASTETITRTLAVDDIAELDVEASAGTLDVAFGDVEEAVLDITSGPGRGDWTFEREGDTLTVASPHRGWLDGWWFGGWMSGPTRATLTLPRALDGDLDAHLELAAGKLTTTGGFGELELDVSAGDLQVDGAAETLSAEVAAGRAELDIADVRTADLTVSAGAMVADFTGDAPTDTTIDVSAGSLELTLPDDAYAVTVSESAGNVRNDLETSSSAQNAIDVSISAGSVRLRSR
ncbi:MAG TPA: DUF4097 family beta strand repeat-containing protein [Microbacterium sp.]|uniref:DUF4097 family beta strand repeat-containing protein n=1 Tax=Microbacterium sp. TaxID=51671 RepID=UPI002CF6DB60|nr:DUF4097 family beta strand repeat-containing protein [Microbacterium sp.]HWI31038.1 DUF4097 family beta strand repeat-containing protein [Microbacterium sp.]